MNNYSIFNFDIKPKGFHVIEFDGYITKDSVNQARKVLENSSMAKEMADYNYELASHHFSYEVLERRLNTIPTEIFWE